MQESINYHYDLKREHLISKIEKTIFNKFLLSKNSV